MSMGLDEEQPWEKRAITWRTHPDVQKGTSYQIAIESGNAGRARLKAIVATSQPWSAECVIASQQLDIMDKEDEVKRLTDELRKVAEVLGSSIDGVPLKLEANWMVEEIVGLAAQNAALFDEVIALKDQLESRE